MILMPSNPLCFTEIFFTSAFDFFNGSDDCFNSDTENLVRRFSKDVLMKANGSINHKIENGLLVIERIALSDNKPSIDIHIKNCLHGLSAFQRLINKFKNIIKRFLYR